MAKKLDELKQLKEEGEKINHELNQDGFLNPEADVIRLEEAIESQKMSIQEKQGELNKLAKSADDTKAQNQELAKKVSSMKLSIESEENRASELRALLEQKRVVYNNQQQRKESFCLVSGSYRCSNRKLYIPSKGQSTPNAMSWTDFD